jgi:hypothetical protein
MSTDEYKGADDYATPISKRRVSQNALSPKYM